MSIDPRNSKSDAPTSQRTSVSKAASQSTTPSSNQPDNTQKAVSSDKSNATTLESINVKVGQAIKAKVSEVLNVVSTSSGQSNFKVTLDIGGQKLSVKTNIQLQPGQTLALSVNSKGELILPKPVNNQTAPLITALSKVLPHQQPVGKVIGALLQSLPSISADNSQVKQLSEQLTSLLPKPDNFTQTQSQQGLTAKGQLVKQALSQSGVFMENRLATAGSQQSASPASQGIQNTSLLTKATTHLTQTMKSAFTQTTATSAATASTTEAASKTIPVDLKSTISQLINALNIVYASKHSASGQPPRFMAEAEPALLVNPFNFPSALSTANTSQSNEKELSVGDMLKRLAGALNRIQFQQLNSLYQAQTASTDTTTVQTWQMELPFLSSQNQVDSVQVRIDQETDNTSDEDEQGKKSKWTLALTFDLKELGPMFIQVNLSPPTVSSTIWAENQKTLKLINEEAHNLRESFTELGLTVADITCRQGQPSIQKTRLDQQIVDIKA